METTKVRNGRNYDRNAVSRRSAVPSNSVDDPSRTVQSAKDDADINVIVRRFRVTGELPRGARLPSYGDFSQVMDFSSAMQAVRQAQEEFGSLPAGLRDRFGNDPQAFLEFCTNPDNIDELRKLGLANPAPKEDIPAEQAAEGPPPVVSKQEEYDDNRGYVEPGSAVSKPAVKPATANAARDFRKPELRGGK